MEMFCTKFVKFVSRWKEMNHICQLECCAVFGLMAGLFFFFFFFFFFFLTALLAFYSVTIVINEKLHVHNYEGKK